MRNLLALPSERTLFDYSNVTEAGTGFKDSVTVQFVKEAEKLSVYDKEHTKYVGVIQDEVRIKSDLVFNRHTGELVGYVDLDCVSNELLNMEEAIRDSDKAVAHYMLVVMVRSITSRLQYPLAAFATDGITADFLYPIIWQTIRIIHTHAQLNALFICCDGASPNRKFFSLHSENHNSTLHKILNPCSIDGDYLYFISDPPHILKTARNCFANSHCHKRSRQLWNGGDISWKYVVKLFEEHCTGAFRLCPKLTEQHVHLTAFANMKVNLAAQVMSNTVANALRHVFGDDVEPTVAFIRTMNRWFDIMNNRSLRETHRKRNPDVAPFENVEDPRLDWLTNDFLDYFSQWTRSIEERFPHLSKSDKSVMQLSRQTLNGLTITTRSIVEYVKYLLRKCASFILTEYFNQDVLERHFGHCRQKGRLNENPTVWQVCHTLDQVRTVKCQGLAPQRGNVRIYTNDAVDETALP